MLPLPTQQWLIANGMENKSYDWQSIAAVVQQYIYLQGCLIVPQISEHMWDVMETSIRYSYK